MARRSPDRSSSTVEAEGAHTRKVVTALSLPRIAAGHSRVSRDARLGHARIMAKTKKPSASVSDLLRLPPGEPVDLRSIDPRSTPACAKGKRWAGAAQEELA